MEEILSSLKIQIDDLLKTGRQIVIAIDGNCTAGKTTLAAVLEKEYDCNVFHMDDFFSGLSIYRGGFLRMGFPWKSFILTAIKFPVRLIFIGI